MAISTPRKRAANRANAARSTGPRTDEGKARSSRNAVTHGLYARDVVIPGEDEGAYAALHEQLRADLRPVGAAAGLLVERVAVSAWRLRRVVAYHRAVLGHLIAADARHRRKYENPPRRRPERDIGEFVLDMISQGAIRDLSQHEQRLERSLYRALEELRRCRADRAAGGPEGPETPGAGAAEPEEAADPTEDRADDRAGDDLGDRVAAAGDEDGETNPDAENSEFAGRRGRRRPPAEEADEKRGQENEGEEDEEPEEDEKEDENGEHGEDNEGQEAEHEDEREEEHEREWQEQQEEGREAQHEEGPEEEHQEEQGAERCGDGAPGEENGETKPGAEYSDSGPAKPPPGWVYVQEPHTNRIRLGRIATSRPERPRPRPQPAASLIRVLRAPQEP